LIDEKELILGVGRQGDNQWEAVVWTLIKITACSRNSDIKYVEQSDKQESGLMMSY
jgi:hypothetical protein